MPIEAGKIRNVAVVGHRGTGKTSLVEALLFQAGKTNRLGTIEAGPTVADWEEDEQRRQMSLAASLVNVDWQGRKINLVDTPGDSGFQADTVASLRVVEGALVVVSGVMGVEVNTSRVWARAEELELSRVVFVNMLDRERADFYRVLASVQEQLSNRCIAIQLPIGSEHEVTGVVDLLHNCAYMDPSGAREEDPVAIPDEMADAVAEYRTKLLDAVVETDEALMERYLGGEEIPAADIAATLKNAVTRDEIYPVACGVATKNLGTHALLDLIVEGVPSPAKKGSPIETDAKIAAFVFKKVADPFAGRISVFRVYAGEVHPDTTLVNHRDHSKERLGSLMTLEGKEHEKADGFAAGDIGAVAKLKDVQTGDVLVDAEHDLDPPPLGFPEPVMSFAVTAKTKGDEDKVAQALRRLSEEDPTLHLRRDRQTGEELLAGMSQVHVEVAVERARRRFGVEFVDKIVGGVIPQSFRPAVDKGIQESLAHGELAGAPVQGVRVTLVDGSYHTVDSSEMAFKIAGSMAFRSAYEKAQPTLLEPIMELEVTVPDDAVGAINGDLNSRRGRLHGMEPKGGMTAIKAEVPMAEVLTYNHALTSLTGGRGEYHMQFLRYDEVPAHIAQKLIETAKKEKEAVPA